MPQQLIYTSAPVGLTPGRSGFCTVARSASMREALVPQLEQLSYYQRHSTSGGPEHPILAYRAVDVRGSRFHVLSRIQDAGLDFTGRPNFIAHHLVFAPGEIKQLPSPPVILRDWPGWKKSWTEDPRLLENEQWSEFVATTSMPAKTWLAATGNAINGYGLLETRSKYAFLVDAMTDETILTLFAESMELLEVRDERHDFRTVAWQYTFTTSMQEQDNPADFRWRCIRSNNPAADKFISPDRQQLSDVRATRQCKDEEAAFARVGRQAPRFVLEPLDVKITEGSTARFQAKAEGIPSPTYQWLSVDRTNRSQPLTGEISQEFVASNPVFGVSRYVVQASNSAGNVMSRTATLSVERKPVLVEPKSVRPLHLRQEKSEQEKKKEWQEFQLQETRSTGGKSHKLGRVIGGIGVALVVILVVAIVCLMWMSQTHPSTFGNLLPAKWQFYHSSTITNTLDKAQSQTTNQAVNTNGANLSSHTNEVGSKTEKTEASSERKSDIELPPPTDYHLPTGWTTLRIGGLSYSHAECLTNKQQIRFDLSVAGGGFRTDGDDFFFVCKTNLSKESTFTATLIKIDPPLTSSICGIMIRESQTINSPFLFIGASSDKFLVYLRETNGGPILEKDQASRRGRVDPITFQFHQKNGVFVPNCSLNNWEWSLRPKFAINANRPMLIGLAVCSGSSTNVMAQFIKVSDYGSAKAK